MGGPSYNVRDKSGSGYKYPWSSLRKSSRGTAALGASKKRLRYRSRSGSGSRSRRRRLRGTRSSRSGGGSGSGSGRGGSNNEDGDNDNDGNIGDDGKDVEYGGGGRRDSGNCNGNFRSADLGMRRGGNGLIPIPAASNDYPPSLFPSSSSASLVVSSLPMTAEVGERRGVGGGGSVVGRGG